MTQLSSRAPFANAIRALSMDAVQQANSGHPGAPMGMAEIGEVRGVELSTNEVVYIESRDQGRASDLRGVIAVGGSGGHVTLHSLHSTGVEGGEVGAQVE